MAECDCSRPMIQGVGIYHEATCAVRLGESDRDLLRERDEAREALRELRDAVKAGQAEPRNRDIALRAMAALGRAGEVLEGVERTHALVPIGALTATAQAIHRLCLERQSTDGYGKYMQALTATARGERVEWPS